MKKWGRSLSLVCSFFLFIFCNKGETSKKTFLNGVVLQKIYISITNEKDENLLINELFFNKFSLYGSSKKLNKEGEKIILYPQLPYLEDMKSVGEIKNENITYQKTIGVSEQIMLFENQKIPIRFVMAQYVKVLEKEKIPILGTPTIFIEEVNCFNKIYKLNRTENLNLKFIYQNGKLILKE